MRWINNSSHPARRRSPPNDDFHAWMLSLPWVVERSHLYEGLGVRTFAIECEPVDIRQLWLVSWVRDLRVAVLVPDSMAERYEAGGLGRALAPMPPDHTLFGLYDELAVIDRERVVIEAYGVVFSR